MYMHMKQFSAQSAIKWTTQGMMEKILESVNRRKYKDVNNCVVHASGCLQKRNLAGKFANFDHTCTTAPAVQFCVVPLDLSSYFAVESNARNHCELCHLDL